MKVLYVLNIFPKISETFILNEMLEMQQKGVSVEVYAYKDAKEGVVHPRAREIREVRYLYKVDPFRWVASHLYWILRNAPGYCRAWALVLSHGELIRKNFFTQLYDTVLLDRRRPTHVHAHYSDDASNLAMVYSRLSGVPFSFTTHMHDIYDTPAPNFPVKSRLALKHVTISEFNKRVLVENFRVSPEDIAVIHCGIDLSRVRRRNEVPANEDLFCSARLHPDKGLDVLIHALSSLRDQGWAGTLRVAGEGPERAALEDLIRKRRLERHVVLLGNQTQEQVFGHLGRSRLFVLPSRSEGIPVSLMEAMAAGVPVISTAIRGIPELIKDGVSGSLVPPDDAAALANKIQALLKDDALCARFASAGFEKVAADFDLSKETQKLLEIWKRSS